MNPTQKNEAFRIYLILASMFIAALVVSNLIFQKFFYWNPFGLFNFELSVGILPYPLTFLITDIISEIYGKKKANEVVFAGIFASFFSIGIIFVANFVPALEDSPVSNETFTQVFGLSPIAVLSSMLAYLFAQFIDIRIYHFWKKKTKGNHLWLRNNFSTFSSQLIDTFTIIFLLCSFDVLPWNLFGSLLLSGFLFKVIIALFDTPLLYLAVGFFRRRYKLSKTTEIELN